MLNDVPVDLLCGKVLPYLDRRGWNAFTLSCKEIHEASKNHLPPWPGQVKLGGEISEMRDPTWSHCGTKVACNDCFKIHIFDQRHGRLANTGWVSHSSKYVSCLAFSQNGKILLSAGDDMYVRLWNVASDRYELLQEWDVKLENSPDSPYIRGLVLSPCGQYVGILQDGGVLIKNLEDGSTIHSLLDLLPFRCTSNLLFSHDGHTLIFGGSEAEQGGDEEEVIKLWQPTTGDVISIKAGNGNEGITYSCLQNLALSHDGTMLASTCQFKMDVKLWTINRVTGGLDIKSVFTPNDGLVSSACFTPDDQYLVVGAGSEDAVDDAGVRFWRIADGECTKALITNGCVSALSYSPDGKRLLVRDLWWSYIKSIDPEQEDIEDEADDGEQDDRSEDLAD